MDNSYPERFIHSSRLPRPCPTSPPETEGLTTLNLPYLKGPSNIRTFFRPTRSLRQILCHPKDPVPAHQQAGVVYKIPCSDCPKSYIEQTGRTFAQRVKEHQRAVRTFDVNNSALAEHVISTNHRIDLGQYHSNLSTCFYTSLMYNVVFTHAQRGRCSE